jgi:Immunity protein 8
MRGHLIKSREHTIFMTRYDYAALAAHVEEFVQPCDADKWEELGLQLCHLGQWEFEYRVSRRRHMPRAFDTRRF